jgi:hypothetical protein
MMEDLEPADSMEITKLYGSRFATLEKLENAVVLLAKKPEHLPELKALKSKSLDCQQLLATCNVMMSNTTNLKCRYENVLQKSRVLQLIMLQKLEEVENIPPHSNMHSNSLQPTETPASQPQPKLNLETPARMFLADYATSPFVRKVKPVKLEFLDFETAVIEEADFQKIPKYMRNRESRAELQAFMETIIVPCFTEKYAMFHRTREFVKHPADLEKWRLYQSQSNYFPGTN